MLLLLDAKQYDRYCEVKFQRKSRISCLENSLLVPSWLEGSTGSPFLVQQPSELSCAL
jgi:hypothetical protein